MADRLTKNDWEQQILNYYTKISEPILAEELATWWHSNTSMRLQIKGYNRFKNAGINFEEFTCEVPSWNGAVTVGLNRAPFPFYLEASPLKHSNVLYLAMADVEYAMLFVLMDKDLTRFARGFYDEVI